MTILLIGFNCESVSSQFEMVSGLDFDLNGLGLYHGQGLVQDTLRDYFLTHCLSPAE